MEVVAIFLLIVFACMLITVGIMFFLKSSKGKIDIVLDKYSFNSGDEVVGKVILKLKKDVAAKELKVGLLAVKIEDSKRISNGKITNTNNSYNLFEFYQPLDGEKTYLKGDREYAFKITIPSDVLNKYKMNSPLVADIIKGVSALAGVGSRIDWFVMANLSVSGLDLNKKVKIIIN